MCSACTLAVARQVAVVFFLDGPLASDWSYSLIHAATILLAFGAEFIYTAEDPTNPSVDARYPATNFPMPGPGMFVEMLKKSVRREARGRSREIACAVWRRDGLCWCVAALHARCHVHTSHSRISPDRPLARRCRHRAPAGATAVARAATWGASSWSTVRSRCSRSRATRGERDKIMIVGDRFDTDVRAGVLAGIKSCLLESGAHTLDMADEFPTDIPSYTCKSIEGIAPSRELDREQSDARQSCS